MLRTDDGSMHNFILIFSMRCLQHNQIVKSNIGQRPEKCIAMTRESYCTGTLRGRTLWKVPNCMMQRFLVNALRNSR